MIDKLNNDNDQQQDKTDLESQDSVNEQPQQQLADGETNQATEVEQNVQPEDPKGVPKKELVDWEINKETDVEKNLQHDDPKDATKKELVDWDTDQGVNKDPDITEEQQSNDEAVAPMDIQEPIQSHTDEQKDKNTDQEKDDKVKDFAWQDDDTTFLDEDQIYMNLQQDFLRMQGSCNAMLEKKYLVMLCRRRLIFLGI